MRHSVHRVKIMVEKVPQFSAESLCLRQGMVTSGRWCHMTQNTSWRMTAGMSRPVSLFSPGLPWTPFCVFFCFLHVKMFIIVIEYTTYKFQSSSMTIPPTRDKRLRKQSLAWLLCCSVDSSSLSNCRPLALKMAKHLLRALVFSSQPGSPRIGDMGYFFCPEQGSSLIQKEIENKSDRTNRADGTTARLYTDTWHQFAMFGS